MHACSHDSLSEWLQHRGLQAIVPATIKEKANLCSQQRCESPSNFHTRASARSSTATKTKPTSSTSSRKHRGLSGVTPYTGVNRVVTAGILNTRGPRPVKPKRWYDALNDLWTVHNQVTRRHMPRGTSRAHGSACGVVLGQGVRPHCGCVNLT